MVRIGVFSDTHIGRAVPNTVAEHRRRAFRHAFSRAVDLFIREDVDYVIHAGDLFERRSMTPGDSILVKDELQRLVDGLDGEVKILMVRGNHDGTPENNALDYVKHPLAKYLEVLGEGTLRGERELYEDGIVAAVGLGYTPYPSPKIREAEGVIRNSLEASRSKVKLFIAHMFIEGHQDIPPGVPGHQIVSLDNVRRLGADLVISGHHHQYSPTTDLDGVKILTPGATEAIDLSDTGPHGVLIIDLEEGVKVQFRPIKPLYGIKSATVEGGEAPRPREWFKDATLNQIRDYTEELEGQGVKGILRIALEGVVEEGRYDLELELENLIRRVKEEEPLLLHVEVESRLNEKGVTQILRGTLNREELLMELFKPLDEEARAKALELVNEVELALEEEASTRTGLLTESRRREYVERWKRVMGEEG
ncbi:MAG: metallophosphoesterase [Candidatus Bathyarchaeia archaeon]